MPILGMIHIGVALLFAVHALRTGREMYWLFILFMFPLLGSIVYAVVVWLPEMRHSVGTRRVVRRVRETLDPGRELRQAQEDFDLAPTVQNRLRLADALAATGSHAEAAQLYSECLKGVYRDDADIELRYARALLESDQAEKARGVLEMLIAREPALRSPEGHLLYARAVAACGSRDQAKHEFDTLIGYSASFEARARYAEALAQWGETDAARALATEALKHVSRMPKHATEFNSPWIKALRRYRDS